MRPDGSRLTSLLGRESKFEPIDVSPDGRLIAYQNADTSEVDVSRADGTGLRRVLSSTTDLRYLTFSPDGSTVAIVRNDGDDHPELFVVDADGRNRRRLGRAGPPDFSADGKLLAYHTVRGCMVATAPFTSEGQRIPGACGYPEFSPQRGLARVQDGDPLRDRDHAAAGAARRARRRAPTLAGHVRRSRVVSRRTLARLPQPRLRVLRLAESPTRREERPWRLDRASGRLRPPPHRPGRRGGWRGLLLVAGRLPPGDRGRFAAPRRLLRWPREAHRRPAAQLGVVHGATLVARRHAAHLSGAHRARPHPALEPSRRRLGRCDA